MLCSFILCSAERIIRRSMLTAIVLKWHCARVETTLTLLTVSPCSPSPLPLLSSKLASGTGSLGLMVVSSTGKFERARRLKKPHLECSCETDSSGGGRRQEMTSNKRRAENKERKWKPGDGNGNGNARDCCDNYKYLLSVAALSHRNKSFTWKKLLHGSSYASSMKSPPPVASTCNNNVRKARQEVKHESTDVKA